MPEAGGATERLAWVEQFAQTRDTASVCRQFAICRATLRKWWLRYEASGPAGLEEASRKPRSSPNRKVFEAEAALIHEMRSRGFGVSRIRAELRAGHRLDVSATTIRKVLRGSSGQPFPGRATAPVAPSLFAAALPDDGISRLLAAEISKGSFRPGERLTEELLAQRFRVGRTRIRQALRSLAMIGLVRIERNRGAVVAMPSDEVVADAYEARRIVEATIVQHVAACHSREQIEALRHHLRRQSDAERCGDKVSLVHLLTDFHLLLASMARNQFLRSFVETLASTTSLAVLLYDQSEAPSHAVAEHRELVQLLEQGKGAAASALMLRHLGRNQERQERAARG